MHCKGLQGTTGTLQGNQTTGIFNLQGYAMLVITCNIYRPSTGTLQGKLVINTGISILQWVTGQ